jgi:hypothetical protein
MFLLLRSMDANIDRPLENPGLTSLRIGILRVRELTIGSYDGSYYGEPLQKSLRDKVPHLLAASRA